jgi:signal transduction histidine kinase
MLGGQLGPIDEGQQRHLARIKRNALGLLRLINGLLDLSRIEESRLRLLPSRIEVAPFLARIADRAQALADRKQIPISLEVESTPVVEADAEKLETVVVNLLANALKFTSPGGEVHLTVGERDGRASIAVRDTGPGIPAQELTKIFDRFYQVDQSPTRQHGGVGIGLALAKELVELHGGTLSVESEIGVGSTFSVLLPMGGAAAPSRQADAGAAAGAEPRPGIHEWADQLMAGDEYRFLDIDAATERRLAPRQEARKLDAPRLLVVEDNPDMLRYLHQVLSEDYEVWPVLEGERAWELLLRERHDVVVTDIMMPGLSGLDLCKRIKADARTLETPVVFLTARGATDERVTGHEAGCDAYLSKPFSPLEVRAVVDRLLADKTRRGDAAERRRAASLETLLAGMAHELRNAAHQVQSSHAAIAELLRRPAGDAAPPDREALAQRIASLESVSKKAIARISAVVAALQQYAHGGSRGWAICALDEVVESQVALLAGTEPAGARLSVRLASGARVSGPADGLRQLVINLVENAIQAIGPGGRVEVETRKEEQRALLVVKDNGHGMTEEVRQRAFDPFFTTRAPGRGTGLGLALVRRTVADVGGEIALHSRQGIGTEVVVGLPLAPANGEATARAADGR